MSIYDWICHTDLMEIVMIPLLIFQLFVPISISIDLSHNFLKITVNVEFMNRRQKMIEFMDCRSKIYTQLHRVKMYRSSRFKLVGHRNQNFWIWDDAFFCGIWRNSCGKWKKMMMIKGRDWFGQKSSTSFSLCFSDNWCDGSFNNGTVSNPL